MLGSCETQPEAPTHKRRIQGEDFRQPFYFAIYLPRTLQRLMLFNFTENHSLSAIDIKAFLATEDYL